MTTIIKPNKKYYQLDRFLFFVTAVLLAVVFSGIFIYNSVVNLQHFKSLRIKSLEEIKLANVDLKNKLYQITESKNLIYLAEKSNMIKVNNPDFLSLEQQVAAR